MNILITAGATREPIDGVRYLSNVSTGATGAALAVALAARGHTMTLLRGEGSVSPPEIADMEIFSSAEDLRQCLQLRLAAGSIDLVIMVAAVADYRPAHVQKGKLSSDSPDLTLQLVRNPKILPQLKSFSPQPLRVVGFKLTVGATAAERHAAVENQFSTGAVDAVVHNDLDEIRGAKAHPFWLYTAIEQAPQPIIGVESLAEALLRIPS